jgi:hypothetical protein
VSRTPVIGCGLYVLNLQCPDCGAVTEIPVVLDTRLTVDSAGAKLSAKLNGKPVDHLCGQLRLVPPADPEPDLQPGFFREPDHRERAAGDMT